MKPTVKIPLKAWVMDEAVRHNVTENAIYNRLARKKYPDLKLEKKNARVMFVIQDESN